MPRRPEYRHAYLAACLAQFYPHVPATFCADTLADAIRLARAYKLHAERECTHQWYESRAQGVLARLDKRAARLVQLFAERFAPSAPGDRAPPTLQFGGDPRGPCGWLHVPGERGDGWAADDGFALYD